MVESYSPTDYATFYDIGAWDNSDMIDKQYIVWGWIDTTDLLTSTFPTDPRSLGNGDWSTINIAEFKNPYD